MPLCKYCHRPIKWGLGGRWVTTGKQWRCVNDPARPVVAHSPKRDIDAAERLKIRARDRAGELYEMLKRLIDEAPNWKDETKFEACRLIQRIER